MSTTQDIVLISSDLMFASRLELAVRASGFRVTRVSGDWTPTPVAGVFVDLNADVEDRIEAIRLLRRSVPALPIIGFCNHEEKERRKEAMAAGATQVVTNGGLQGVALRLVGAAVS